MKIHEYQAKEIFQANGIITPQNVVATTPGEYTIAAIVQPSFAQSSPANQFQVVMELVSSHGRKPKGSAEHEHRSRNPRQGAP